MPLKYSISNRKILSLQVVLNGNTASYGLTGLSPFTEYEAMLTAIFQDKSESDTASVLETTRKTIHTFLREETRPVVLVFHLDFLCFLHYKVRYCFCTLDTNLTNGNSHLNCCYCIILNFY